MIKNEAQQAAQIEHLAETSNPEELNEAIWAGKITLRVYHAVQERWAA